MMQDEADRWWKGMKRMIPTQAQARRPYVNYERFKELFNDKYFPLSLKMEKKSEFMDLKQTRDMFVAQYEDAFTQLIKYMPIYETDERIEEKKFLEGLKLRI